VAHRKVSAVLLDRDGVINREIGRGVLTWNEFEFLPGVLHAFKGLAALTVPVVVVSNQSAIGRGWLDAETVDSIHERMVAAIRQAGGRIDEVLICPHGPDDGCHCRKPKPGLLLKAAQLHQFNLHSAVMVGDSYRDIQAAQAAGAIPIMVRSGHAISPKLEKRLVAANVLVAADLEAVAIAIHQGSPFSVVEGES
jgi:D-glycero-D-manno-heptose 1,7-bisphosphate phosphatase